MITVIHFAFAIALYYISGFIGRYSRPFGYVDLYTFSRVENAPAFNYIYRVAMPNVYIFLVTHLLYYLGYDEYTANIWVIVLFYFLIVYASVVIKGRARLFNVKYAAMVSSVSLSVSYFVYVKVLIPGKFYLPSEDAIVSQLWFVSILFIYNITNKIDFSGEGEQLNMKREDQYIISKYNKFNTKYAHIVDLYTSCQHIRLLIFSIMIVEDFNRPQAIRTIERLFPYFISKTTGVMQVKGHERLTDEESVSLASEMIVELYNEKLRDVISKRKHLATEDKNDQNDRWERYIVASHVIRRYNKGTDYFQMVENVLSRLTSVVLMENSVGSDEDLKSEGAII